MSDLLLRVEWNGALAMTVMQENSYCLEGDCVVISAHELRRMVDVLKDAEAILRADFHTDDADDCRSVLDERAHKEEQR